jgi:hypothetical protein
MKKLLLTFAAFGVIAMTANAQTRLSLYEEFSGENCGPCAASNPGLNALMASGTNPSKALLIKYQTPIPTAGPIYNIYKTVTNARLSYYNVPFAPYGRLDGTGLGTGPAAPTSPGHVANLTQGDLNTASGMAAPFNIVVTGDWNATGDSVTATIDLSCVANYAPASGILKLRVAMIEHLVYATPPGTNGETEFHNVVREMYPDANGTALAASWTAGQSQSFTLTGRAPYFVDKANRPKIVVWIQNDADKSIAQAAVSPELPLVNKDIAITALSASAPKMTCTGNSIAPTVTITNKGTSSITGGTIFYKFGTAGAWSNQAWVGTLAAGASTNVSLAAIAAPNTAGTLAFTDSMVIVGDQNVGNNSANSSLLVVSSTPKILPFTCGWENTVPAGWYFYDSDGSGQTWINGNGTKLAHNESSFMAWYRPGFTAGSSSMIVMPTPTVEGPTGLDFWVAYAQVADGDDDKLEVVSSTDCGATWTSMWSKQGADLATESDGPVGTDNWLPDPEANSPDWKQYTIDLTNLPAGALLAFKATAGGGNNMFLDDLRFHAGTTGISDLISENKMSLSPNPAKDLSKLAFELKAASNVQVEIYDIVGKLVSTVANQHMGAGAQTVDINTANLPAGLYNVKVSAGSTMMVERLSVTK